jgi:hypothetical protein
MDRKEVALYLTKRMVEAFPEAGIRTIARLVAAYENSDDLEFYQTIAYAYITAANT